MARSRPTRADCARDDRAQSPVRRAPAPLLSVFVLSAFVTHAMRLVRALVLLLSLSAAARDLKVAAATFAVETPPGKRGWPKSGLARVVRFGTAYHDGTGGAVDAFPGDRAPTNTSRMAALEVCLC